MVTISRIRTKRVFGASIRWKILLAFFVIVGLSFGVAATNLTGLVSEYLFEQRTKEDSLLTEKAASAVTPFFASAAVEDVNRVLAENARNMEGRLMLIDNDGKVQYDTFGTLCGRRLQLEEVLQVDLIVVVLSNMFIHVLVNQLVEVRILKYMMVLVLVMLMHSLGIF